MRRALLAATAALVLALSLGASAQAKCGLACLNHRVRELSNGLTKAEKKISSLNQTVSAQGQAIAQQQQALGALGEVGKKVDALYACLFEVPVTQFGEPGGPFGYLFQFETKKKNWKRNRSRRSTSPTKGNPSAPGS